MTVPFCKDCVHFHREWSARQDSHIVSCRRKPIGYDVVYGRQKFEVLGCREERSRLEPDKCGPDGRFFEKKVTLGEILENFYKYTSPRKDAP